MDACESVIDWNADLRCFLCFILPSWSFFGYTSSRLFFVFFLRHVKSCVVMWHCSILPFEKELAKIRPMLNLDASTIQSIHYFNYLQDLIITVWSLLNDAMHRSWRIYVYLHSSFTFCSLLYWVYIYTVHSLESERKLVNNSQQVSVY